MADHVFDPSGAADLSLGIFGLPFPREQSALVVIPVPFEATVSYGVGTGRGPEAVRTASAQVDLLDRRFGDVWKSGIHLEDARREFAEWGERARQLAAPIISRGGAEAGDSEVIAEIDDLGSRAAELVEKRVAAALAEGRIPCVLGGEHAVSLGALRACGAHHGEIGILQIDAHMDLRRAFEGFRYSHASVMLNALEEVPSVSRLVQVGIRDFCAEEVEFAQARADQVVTHYDDDMFDPASRGESYGDMCRRIVEDLPESVYVTFDIDGLDPSLCPHTGTPVPGGLGFREASTLLETLARSGRKIVGCDLVEVAPGEDGSEWDANVGARMLFRLCMAALLPLALGGTSR